MQIRWEERLPDLPAYGRLEAAGGMGELFVRFVRASVKPPYEWWPACVQECALTLRRCLAPLLISICFWMVGFAMMAVSGIVSTIGTPDRVGTGITLGHIRESSYWITSMVFAGVVGSAMTADLGARKIREELDAFRVLAVDPIRTLVVPRIVALLLMGPVLLVLANMAGLAVVYLFGPQLIPQLDASDIADTSTTYMVGADMISAALKAFVTGLFVGVVCCYKGLSARGGAEGVGRAVNEAVLITFISLWAFGALWNQTFFALFPDALTLRA